MLASLVNYGITFGSSDGKNPHRGCEQRPTRLLSGVLSYNNYCAPFHRIRCIICRLQTLELEGEKEMEQKKVHCAVHSS